MHDEEKTTTTSATSGTEGGGDPDHASGFRVGSRVRHRRDPNGVKGRIVEALPGHTRAVLVAFDGDRDGPLPYDSADLVLVDEAADAARERDDRLAAIDRSLANVRATAIRNGHTLDAEPGSAPCPSCSLGGACLVTTAIREVQSRADVMVTRPAREAASVIAGLLVLADRNPLRVDAAPCKACAAPTGVPHADTYLAGIACGLAFGRTPESTTSLLRSLALCERHARGLDGLLVLLVGGGA